MKAAQVRYAVTNSTTSGNSASNSGAGGIGNTGTLTLKSTLLANNTHGNCALLTAQTSDGYNLSDDQTCLSTLTQSSDKNGTPAVLDAVNTDQRGIERPQGTGCDIGAYELIGNVPFSSFSSKLTILTGSPSVFALDGSFNLGGSSGGIKPLTETVMLYIASFTLIIPAGSFRLLWIRAEHACDN